MQKKKSIVLLQEKSFLDDLFLQDDELLVIRGGFAEIPINCGFGCGLGCGSGCGENCTGCTPPPEEPKPILT